MHVLVVQLIGDLTQTTSLLHYICEYTHKHSTYSYTRTQNTAFIIYVIYST